MKKSPKSLMRLMAFAVLFGTASLLHAQDNSTLVLWHANGTQTRIELYKQPRVTFGDGTVDILSPVLNQSYPAADVLKFTYEGNGTGISDAKADQPYSSDGERILFDASVRPDQIALYTSDGIRVPVRIQQTDRGAVLPLSAIPTGVYLLTAGSVTSKFVKR